MTKKNKKFNIKDTGAITGKMIYSKYRILHDYIGMKKKGKK